MADVTQSCIEAANAVAAELDADVFIFIGPMFRESVEKFCKQVRQIKARKQNAAIILKTLGGDPNAAFIMARAIQRAYRKSTLLVFNICKSAGTLLAVAANEIVMSDTGELGPLDIQLGKDDEIYKRSSGLDITESIRFLRTVSSDLFYKEFLKLKQIGTLTTKTAAEIAQGLATGIVQPIAAQIDPLRLGEAERSMRIVRDYGKLLNPRFDELEGLALNYPAHAFVIDREQAMTIFGNVRDTTPAECLLGDEINALPEDEFIHFFTPATSAPAPAGDSAAATQILQPHAHPIGNGSPVANTGRETTRKRSR